jgi:formylglycine-generating enzyme required for sulfatase activity
MAKLMCLVVAAAAAFSVCAAEGGAGNEFTNSIGMKLVRIEAGSFMMGQEREADGKSITQTYGDRHFMGGELDEQPVHKVTISRPFYMSATEVTNAQYEQFDPSHRQMRGVKGLSNEDDEAVVNVSWHEAVAFCKWLSKKEKRPYRLPAEAEWEYACRAGTTTRFNTGDTLPEVYQKAQKHKSRPDKVVEGRTRGKPQCISEVTALGQSDEHVAGG